MELKSKQSILSRGSLTLENCLLQGPVTHQGLQRLLNTCWTKDVSIIHLTGVPQEKSMCAWKWEVWRQNMDATRHCYCSLDSCIPSLSCHIRSAKCQEESINSYLYFHTKSRLVQTWDVAYLPMICHGASQLLRVWIPGVWLGVMSVSDRRIQLWPWADGDRWYCLSTWQVLESSKRHSGQVCKEYLD